MFNLCSSSQSAINIEYVCVLNTRTFLLTSTPWLFLFMENDDIVHEDICSYWCLNQDVSFVANCFDPTSPLLIGDLTPIPFGTVHPLQDYIFRSIVPIDKGTICNRHHPRTPFFVKIKEDHLFICFTWGFSICSNHWGSSRNAFIRSLIVMGSETTSMSTNTNNTIQTL